LAPVAEQTQRRRHAFGASDHDQQHDVKRPTSRAAREREVHEASWHRSGGAHRVPFSGQGRPKVARLHGRVVAASARCAGPTAIAAVAVPAADPEPGGRSEGRCARRVERAYQRANPCASSRMSPSRPVPPAASARARRRGSIGRPRVVDRRPSPHASDQTSQEHGAPDDAARRPHIHTVRSSSTPP